MAVQEQLLPFGDVGAENMADARHFDDILLNAFLWGGVVTCVLGLIGAGFVGTGKKRAENVYAVRQFDVAGVQKWRCCGRSMIAGE